MVTTKLTEWKMNAYHPYVPILHNSVETGNVMSGVLHPIDAKVPGSVYADLLRAGLIEDPYYERNSFACAWVKEYWWMYKTTFYLDSSLSGRQIYLRLNGIDYKGYISINGRMLCEHEGAFIPRTINITDFVVFNQENHVTVTLENAPDEMGQIGRTSKVRHHKPRFTYRWDFAPRMVGIGLYDEVMIEDFGLASIESVHIDSVNQEENWSIDCSVELKGFVEGDVNVIVLVQQEGKEITAKQIACHVKKGITSLSCQLPIEDPKLWWPNGHGEQPLYTVTITVENDGKISDQKQYQTGLRTLEYQRCEGAGENSLPYLPIINGKPIYIKGVNMVPIDMMHGCVKEERIQKTLQAVRDSNCNLVRIWGGGVIESEAFYDLCDQYGLMVFQEFLQSSSGIDNVPSKDSNFCRMLGESAESAIKTKRNHVSLTYWSGGNELRQYIDEDTPADYSDENIHMLQELVVRLNPKILMLPTCASGPREFLSVNDLGNNHDVHGPWNYRHADCEYHELYNRSDAQLHSEFGVDGMGNLESLRQFLSPDNCHVHTIGENLVWRHHAEWWETLSRDQAIFGPFEKDQLEDYIACSQFIQYEGIRYALEANRRRAFRCCGSILWQFNEPWPNISCTNVWDYYGRPKAAYYAVKQAYRTTTPTLRYDNLILRPKAEAKFSIIMCNDGIERDGSILIKAELNGKQICNKTTITHIRENGSTFVECLSITPKTTGNLLVTIVWHDGKERIESQYPFFVLEKGDVADRNFVRNFCKDLSM